MSLKSRMKIAGFAIFFVMLFFPAVPSFATVEVGQAAPDFTLRSLSGGDVSLKDHRGEIVLVDFWATWCVPCRKTIPELIEINNKYSSKGVVILGISVDNPDSFDDKYILDFMKKYKMNYTVLRSEPKVVEVYLGVVEVYVPTLFIVDKEGKVVGKVVGYEAGAPEKAVKKLLGE